MLGKFRTARCGLRMLCPGSVHLDGSFSCMCSTGESRERSKPSPGLHVDRERPAARLARGCLDLPARSDSARESAKRESERERSYRCLCRNSWEVQRLCDLPGRLSHARAQCVRKASGLWGATSMPSCLQFAARFACRTASRAPLWRFEASSLPREDGRADGILSSSKSTHQASGS